MRNRATTLQRIMGTREENIVSLNEWAANCLEEYIDFFYCDEDTFKEKANALANYWPKYVAYHKEESAND